MSLNTKIFSFLRSSDARPLLWLFSIDIIVILATTFLFGIAHVDTASYTDQIVSFRHFTFFSPDQWAQLRAYKPSYAIISLALPFLTPETILLSLNALLLFGLSSVSYLLFLELGFQKRYSFLGAAWVATGYPVLAYGFALGTDISGWFFCIASMLAVLIGVRTDTLRYIFLASLIGFIGAASKETGVLGLVFGGIYILLHGRSWGFNKTLKYLLFLSLPAIVLESILLFCIHLSGLPAFLGFLGASQGLAQNVHTLKFFLGGELATFHALWIPALVGLYAIVKKHAATKEQTLQITALVAAALPVLAWPIFLDRVLYVQFFAVIPLALFGAHYWLGKIESHKKKTAVFYLLFGIPLFVSIFLVTIGGHDGLYMIEHHIISYIH